MENALSKTGQRLLANAERVIEDGLSTFLKVGKALTEIRDGKLYRAEYPTFEDYCRGRWGFSRQRAHQLIEAAEVSTIVDVENEAQARALAPLADDPAAAREAWDEASADGKPTAAKVAAAVQRRTVTETTETRFDPETGEVIESSEGVGSGSAPADAAGAAGGSSDPTPAPAPSVPANPKLVLLLDLSKQRAEVAKWLAFDRHEEAIAAMDAEKRADYRSFVLSVFEHASRTLDAIDGSKLRAVK